MKTKTRIVLLSLAFLASIATAQAFTKSGNIYTTNGSASDVQKAVDGASDGSTVTLPTGDFTWNSQVTIKKAITVSGEGTKLTMNSGPAFLFSFHLSSAGHSQLAGIKFLQGNVSGDQTAYVEIIGTGQIPIVHDCSFSIGNFQIGGAIHWFCTGGLCYGCHFYSDTDGGGGGWGSGSGCIRVTSNIPWVAASTFGALDTNGDKNLYFEDCIFDNIYNQCIDCDDNGRIVVRYCTINNTQFLTHGTTSKEGGRQVELYHNGFNYVIMPPNSQGWKTVNVNRWVWWRAGTGRVHDNKVDKINSGDWGNKPSWNFMAESLTRSGAGSGCQTEADYQGVHWPGSGGDGTKQVPDPIYFWNNTGEGADVWTTSDQQGYDCHGGSSANVIKLGRDIIFGVPAGYAEYKYPHPLRTGGSGGGGGLPTPSPTATPVPTPSATPTPVSTPTPCPSPTPGESPSYEKWIEKQNDWIRANPPKPD